MEAIIGILLMLALALLFGPRTGGTRGERNPSYPSSWPRPDKMGYPPEVEEGPDAPAGEPGWPDAPGNSTGDPGGSQTAGPEALADPMGGRGGCQTAPDPEPSCDAPTTPSSFEYRAPGDTAWSRPSERGFSVLPESQQDLLRGIVLAEILNPPRALAARRR